jgi:hypothetical protein
MTSNEKLAIGAAVLFIAWVLWDQSNANASTVPSPSATGSQPATCSAPSFPCSDKFPGMAGCCTPCSANPSCSVTQTGSQPLDNTQGGDGPITNPSQTDISGGPLVTPDQV